MTRNYGSNRTLYGLRTDASFRIGFNAGSGLVTRIIGADAALEDVEAADATAFNLPHYLVFRGVPYFPSKYQFTSGEVWYHARRPPSCRIVLRRPYGVLSENAKTMRVRVTPEMLAEFDRPRSARPRGLSQNQVMGESAGTHAQRLVETGDLSIAAGTSVQWHWCHLVPFTMLPEHRAQIRRNLIAGTAACNGHMANVEAAIKLFIYRTERPVSLELTATILAGTHMGHCIRYRIWEPKSQTLHTEYFDALNDVRSDYADFKRIATELMRTFGGA